MNRDALAEGDVADDVVARHRRAALREPDQHVGHARDDHAHLGAGDGLTCPGRLGDDRRLLRDLLRLQPLDDLVDDRARLQLAGAEREVEVLGLLEPEVTDHLRERRRATQLRERQVLLLERLLE